VYSRELEKRDNEVQSIETLSKKPLVERLQVKTGKAHPISQEPTESGPPNIIFSREKLTIKPRPIKERIAELQKAGFSPELIAKRLGLNPGEVQLYFNLAEKPE